MSIRSQLKNIWQSFRCNKALKKKKSLETFRLLAFLVIFFNCNLAFSASSNWHENQSHITATNEKTSSQSPIQTRLIASFYEKDGNKKLIAALHFNIAEGWKIYGKESDGIGLPPSFDFSNSTNYLNHEIVWPKAEVAEEKIGTESLKYSYYHNEVIIPLLINLKEENKETDLKLKLDFALCKDTCIPVSDEFQLKVGNEIDEKILQEIQKFYPENSITNGETEDLKDSQDLTNKDSIANKKNPQPFRTLILALIFALIGGAILNIMPCVLPVLSIKLISIINHSNASQENIRKAFASTIIGILCCFVGFAALASIIKITGNSLGWGLQFQNPYFLIFLIITLTFFAADLLGVFEITFSQFLANFLSQKIAQKSAENKVFITNFLSGVLAVMLATPCSAPFLGSAISFALAQNFLIIFLVFSFIGIGFSLPYILLCASPNLINFLPKSGAWTSRVKQLMAGFLLATIIWLIEILSKNLGALSAFVVAILAVGIFGSLKIKTRFLRVLFVSLLIILTTFLPFDLQRQQINSTKQFDSLWQNFDEAEIQHYVDEGKVVVVDVTADWCITCKFNKFRVLKDPEIVEMLKSGKIIGLRADITKPKTEVTKFLQKHNRFAIPFNAVYGPNAKDGLLTSELLSKTELLELIEKASNK